ncbi:PREDICTED: protein FAM131C [Nanorana parkeri]|uniref:protein FAM131C n=1 Tax=Nanorana parkeri TaxID=125878 RepID=UPI000854C688|nr:PREDICTED: protein FAM131C [Nanorana parkeri]
MSRRKFTYEDGFSEFFFSGHKEFRLSNNTKPASPRLAADITPPPEGTAPTESPEEDEEEEDEDVLQKKCFKTPNGFMCESKANSVSYDITELATSSLIGLVQTIKDHITKPTAMARGRVAHLIEWKGWSAPQSGWEPSLTDEDHYSDLTDELKAARFAAGVAEQFAITEATLSAWSSLDDDEMHYGLGSQEVRQLQAHHNADTVHLHACGAWMQVPGRHSEHGALWVTCIVRSDDVAPSGVLAQGPPNAIV